MNTQFVEADIIFSAVKTDNAVFWEYTDWKDGLPKTIDFGIALLSPAHSGVVSALDSISAEDPEAFNDLIDELSEYIVDYVTDENGYCMTTVSATNTDRIPGGYILSMEAELDTSA